MSPTNIKYAGVAGNWRKLLELLDKYKRLVCKSNEGSGGDSVYLVSNQVELENAAHKIFEASKAMAICPFYKIENEFRVIVLNNSVKLIYSKNIPYVIGDGVSTIRQLLISYMMGHTDCILHFDIPEDENSIILKYGEKYYLNWRHNLGQGATPQIIENKDIIRDLSELALKAVKAINIQFASVDIIKTDDRYLILEINSGVMMEHFSQINDDYYQIAKSIYKEAIENMIK